jgi:hypothetical protein
MQLVHHPLAYLTQIRQHQAWVHKGAPAEGDRRDVKVAQVTEHGLGARHTQHDRTQSFPSPDPVALKESHNVLRAQPLQKRTRYISCPTLRLSRCKACNNKSRPRCENTQ